MRIVEFAIAAVMIVIPVVIVGDPALSLPAAGLGALTCLLAWRIGSR